MNNIDRLSKIISDANIPIFGVAGEQGSVRIDFSPSATSQDITDANAIVSAFDWSEEAHAVWVNLQDRLKAKLRLDSSQDDAKLIRALAEIVRSEINILRAWLVSFKAEVASSTNLANFQSRVASLPSTPDRTLNQLRTAIKDSIDSGDVDS